MLRRKLLSAWAASAIGCADDPPGVLVVQGAVDYEHWRAELRDESLHRDHLIYAANNGAVQTDHEDLNGSPQTRNSTAILRSAQGQ